MTEKQCFGGCGCNNNDIWFWLAILILIWCNYDNRGGGIFGKW